MMLVAMMLVAMMEAADGRDPPAVVNLRLAVVNYRGSPSSPARSNPSWRRHRDPAASRAFSGREVSDSGRL
jgi:hypothetical protein